jgi:hypothetical protein
MKFITNWTIDLGKLPKYPELKKEFSEHIDYALAGLILESTDQRLTPEIKAEFFKLVNRIDKKTNTLAVKYQPRFNMGRRYPHCPCEFFPNGDANPDFKKYYSALISVPRIIKNTIYTFQNWVDLDQAKGHPTILFNMAELNGINLQAYREYLSPGYFDLLVKDMSAYYSVEGEAPVNKGDIKALFNRTIYGGGHHQWTIDTMSGQFKNSEGNVVCVCEPKTIKNIKAPYPFYLRFLADTEQIINLVFTNNPAIRELTCAKILPGEAWKEPNRVMSYFCGVIENDITYNAYQFLVTNKIVQPGGVSWGFDGLTFPNPVSGDLNDIVNQMNAHVQKKCGLTQVKFVVKGFDSCDILAELLEQREQLLPELIDDDSDSDDEDHCEEDDKLSKKRVFDDFEKSHCKIINKAFFIKEVGDQVIILSKPQILVAYEHLMYNDLILTKDGEMVEQPKNMIRDWLTDNPAQRAYQDVGCFPDVSKCPHNVYNTWTPFAMESVTDYIYMGEELALMRKHLLILCGNDEESALYLECFIAQMIQYPWIKSICPTLISKQGAGKGTLMFLLTRMLGISKVFETAFPSRDVWGNFNGMMANTFLVNLNELSKKETLESEGRFKTLVTDATLLINNKGVNQYPITSYHRFIITSNNEDPIKTTHDDRRNFIMRSSDELVGNTEYFNNMYRLLDNVNFIKTCYEYFKSIPGMENFNKMKMPTTAYQNDMKELSVSPIEMWLKDYTYLNFNASEPIELLGKVQYDSFVKWCIKSGIEYKLTLQAFGVRMKRLNINGIEPGRHTKQGETKYFNILKLRKHFKLDEHVMEDASFLLQKMGEEPSSCKMTCDDEDMN